MSKHRQIVAKDMWRCPVTQATGVALSMVVGSNPGESTEISLFSLNVNDDFKSWLLALSQLSDEK